MNNMEKYKDITIEEFMEDIQPEFDNFKNKLEKYKGPFKIMCIDDKYYLEIDLANLQIKL